MKLPTIWTVGKSEGEESERRREEEKRSERRKSEKKEEAGARKSRKVAIHCASGSCHVDKLHAVVAPSTFPSQKYKN